MASRRPSSGRGKRPGVPAAPARPGQRGSARTRAEDAPHRPRFTSRAAVLVLVLAVLAVSYASSMRAYLQQRAHINDLKVQIATSEKAIGELEREKRRWDDRAYVEDQARQRFGWVLPGETAYQVIGRDGQPLAGEVKLTDPSTVGSAVPDAWWSKADASLRAADHPKKRSTPTESITPPPPPKKAAQNQ